MSGAKLGRPESAISWHDGTIVYQVRWSLTSQRPVDESGQLVCAERGQRNAKGSHNMRQFTKNF